MKINTTMMNFLKTLLFLLIVGLSFQCADGPSKSSWNENTEFAFAIDNGGLVLPDGFQAIVVADSVGPALHIAVRVNSGIYVALLSTNNEGGIGALRDTNMDGVADQIVYFGETAGTGIDIQGVNLFFSSTTEIFRVLLDDN